MCVCVCVHVCEEGCVSPTAGGRRRVPRAPTASRYFLRSTQIPACAGVSGAGPGLRPATSTSEERLSRWKRHFEGVLNVPSTVAAEVIANVEDLATTDTTEVTREEVEVAVRKLKNGKAPGSDEIVAELVKNGGQVMVDWLWELLREVWRTKRVPQDWKNVILIPLHKKQSRIWVTRQIIERAAEYNTPAHLCFIDLTKAYDSVNRDALIAVLRNYKVPSHLVDIISAMYTNTWCQVRTTERASEKFKVVSGVRQGCILSPLLFNCFMDRVLREALKMTPGGWRIEYTTTEGLFLSYREKTSCTADIQNIQYADDLTLVAESASELQAMVSALDRACTRWGMTINATKTKTMTVGKEEENEVTITLRGNPLEAVESFSYLGSEVGENAKVGSDVGTRLEKASRVYQKWRKEVFRSRSVSKRTKLHVFRVMVMPVLLYGAETWAVTQQELRKLHAFQMKCLREIVGVTLWDRRRNVDILEETGELPVEEQLRHKRLQWFVLRRMPENRPQKQVLRCQPHGRKRKPGGTSQRWVDLVHKDLSNLPQWSEHVKNRSQWRSIIQQPR